jgi:hypothetical protein
MAERNGPTDGGRYQRHAPSGNHKSKNKRGAPGVNTKAGETLWTTELQDKLVEMIRAGNYAEVAARACGISKDTFYKWLLRGGKGEQPFAALADAIETASAEAQARDVFMMAKHSSKHWQAAAWRLERKYPKLFGRKDSLELTGDDDKPLAVRSAKVDMSRLTPTERELLMKLRDKMRVEEPDDE